jgi:hypothetical protein
VLFWVRGCLLRHPFVVLPPLIGGSPVTGFEYRAPNITGVSYNYPNGVPTTGGFITIVGSNFGRYGELSAAIVSFDHFIVRLFLHHFYPCSMRWWP